jgi:hypothetical protein
MNFLANITRSKGDPHLIEGGPSSLTGADQLARFLGWFSIALGLTEIFAGGRLARALGLEGNEKLMRLFGARELGAGFATLSPDKRFGLWSRVAGDALDLLTLATAFDGRSSLRQRDNARLAILAVLGVTALDVIAARAVSREEARPERWRDYSDRTGLPNGVKPGRRPEHDSGNRADKASSRKAAERTAAI